MPFPFAERARRAWRSVSGLPSRSATIGQDDPLLPSDPESGAAEPPVDPLVGGDLLPARAEFGVSTELPADDSRLEPQTAAQRDDSPTDPGPPNRRARSSRRPKLGKSSPPADELAESSAARFGATSASDATGPAASTSDFSGHAAPPSERMPGDQSVPTNPPGVIPADRARPGHDRRGFEDPDESWDDEPEPLSGTSWDDERPLSDGIAQRPGSPFPEQSSAPPLQPSADDAWFADPYRAAPRPQRSTPLPELEPDYYEVLGIHVTASHEEVALAYRRLAASAYSRRIGGWRATRNLKLLNAAYEVLGKPDRRVDYDRRRAEWLDAHGYEVDSVPTGRRGRAAQAPMDRPRQYVHHDEDGGLGPLIVLCLVAIGLIAAVYVVSTALRDFAPFTSVAAQFGLVEPRTELVVEDGEETPEDPLREPTSGALRFATPTVQPTAGPTRAAGDPATAASPGAAAPDESSISTVQPQSTVPSVPSTLEANASSDGEFAGSAASVSTPSPPSGSDVSIRLQLVRNGQPLAGVPVYAVAHYRTVPNLRWPSANGTVQTNAQGEATITVNIGNATRDFEIKVDVIANVDGTLHTWQTAFTPR